MSRGAKWDETEYWRQMVTGQAASRLSIGAWCRKHNLSEPAFAWWRKRLRREEEGRADQAFVPIELVPDDDKAQIEIILSGNRQVRLRGCVDRQMLADVIAVLETRPC